eukprot:TRINITY_DN1310_c0_g1_i1.p1 TRINITY_DN1310_c0_g1~~TRINITY_DN1310_c0_g1_i1.p1  ORF type:complete len:498 (-),score=114.28 TRINITY_DN1310_c0_g1_i1:289-1710(-)
MTTPVQTWGALGSMVQEQKEFGAKTALYLETHEVHDLFKHLLELVLVERPENPVKFLQESLQAMQDCAKLCVVVMGPPGINRSKYCQQAAQEFKLKHIHVGKLLRGKKELKDQLEAGELVDDSIVIEMVKAELVKSKVGWVLDGFPRTKIQAQALASFSKDVGCLVNSILLLHTSEELIKQRYAAKVAAAGFDMADKEDLINTRIQQYHRHVIGIAELFQNVVRPIHVPEGDDAEIVTYDIIKSSLHVRGFSNAPLRMHRICVVGPCGSGRTTQCRNIAQQYGVVHVDLADLMRKHQQETGKAVEDVPPDFYGDEEICALVGKRLKETDCERKGWVLDGFPKTKAQANFLRQAHLWPSRVIELKTSVEVVKDRVSGRRLDPETGIAYYKPPDDIVIRKRLVQSPFDEPEKVKERYKLFADEVDKVMESWRSACCQLSGDGNPDGVFKQIMDKINLPMPYELAQDASSGVQATR